MTAGSRQPAGFAPVASVGRWLPLLMALPAVFVAALTPPGTAIELQWLLLGSRFALDEVGRIFLLTSALIWTAASLYAALDRDHGATSARFRLFFMLAMAGNFILVLAADAITFYCGFAVMGLSAYALVVHRTGSRRAARCYLGWTLVGEVSLLTALLLVVAPDAAPVFAETGGNMPSDAAMLLLVLAFGIKLGLPGLHWWMPGAYAAAPPVASAVLAGAMINAGLLGWMRLLPVGAVGFSDWGRVLIAMGVFATFFGVAAGLLQRRPKALLAYSSVSQMGLLTAALGLVLATPAQAGPLLAAVSVFALHHGVVKAGLFLALDVHGRFASVWTFGLLIALALALAGAPLTSGAAAKSAYLAASPASTDWVAPYLFISGIATTLLMVRFLLIARRMRPKHRTVAWREASAPMLMFGFSIALAWQLGAAGSGILPLVTGLVIAAAATLSTRGLSAGAVTRRYRAMRRCRWQKRRDGRALTFTFRRLTTRVFSRYSARSQCRALCRHITSAGNKPTPGGTT